MFSFVSLFFRFRGFFPGFTELGLLSFATGDFEEAAKLFEAAVVGDPKGGRAGGTGKHRKAPFVEDIDSLGPLGSFIFTFLGLES